MKPWSCWSLLFGPSRTQTTKRGAFLVQGRWSEALGSDYLGSHPTFLVYELRGPWQESIYKSKKPGCGNRFLCLVHWESSGKKSAFRWKPLLLRYSLKKGKIVSLWDRIGISLLKAMFAPGWPFALRTASAFGNSNEGSLSFASCSVCPRRVGNDALKKK